VNSKVTNAVIAIILLVVIVLGIYVFFGVKPTQEEVSSQQTPVLVVPKDVLSSTNDNKIKDYSANQPVPMNPLTTTKDNPFSPY